MYRTILQLQSCNSIYKIYKICKRCKTIYKKKETKKQLFQCKTSSNYFEADNLVQTK